MQRYSKEEHFSYLSKTSVLVKSSLKETYDSYIKSLDKSVDNALYNDVNVILGQRVHKNQNLLRPYLVRLSLEFANKKWKKYIDLMEAIELFNISTYQSNCSFDRKFINKNDDIAYNKQFITSQLTYFLSTDKVWKCKRLSEPEKVIVVNKFEKAMQDVYLGQYYEQEILNENITKLNYEDYLKYYIKRCSLLDGTQIGISLSLGIFQKDSALSNTLFEIGRNFGIMLQILDDLHDFNRKKENSFSDIKNHRFTLPLYLVIKKKGLVIDKSLNNDKGYLTINDILKENEIISEIIYLLCQYYNNIQDVFYKYELNSEMQQRLDFIFPHIFLSSKMMPFIKNKSEYYKNLRKNIKHRLL